MNVAPEQVFVVEFDGKTHVRHARFKRIMKCGAVSPHFSWKTEPTRVTCRHCARHVETNIPAEPPSRVRIKALPETVDCRLRCSCGVHRTKALPADEPLRKVLAGMTCDACGELGSMSLAPRTDSIPPHAQ